MSMSPDEVTSYELRVTGGPSPLVPIDNRQSGLDNPRLAVIWSALESVTDPEIPVLNVVDMGIIAGVYLQASAVVVEMTPTFVGCPAVEVIRGDLRRAIQAAGEQNVEVSVVFDPPWTSDRMTETGRRKLKEFGLAPPVRCAATSGPMVTATVPCPHCDSERTELESIFGPTLCRSIHYCRNCLQSFESFKNM